jgi:hypothetical protein
MACSLLKNLHARVRDAAGFSYRNRWHGCCSIPGMTRIIAATFEASPQAEAAAQALRDAGFPAHSVSTYHNNAPGQHGLLPIGGDEAADPEAKQAGSGAARGAVVGSVIGAGVGAAIAGPLGAVAGAGVGAYTGAFGGALNRLADEDDTLPPARRAAGIMVAVEVTGPAASEDMAIALMRDHEAVAIEEADGEWRDGQWADFDPLAAPHVIWRNRGPQGKDPSGAGIR